MEDDDTLWTRDDTVVSSSPARYPFVKLGKVVAVRNESHSIDVLFTDTGVTARKVPVLAWNATTVSGVVSLTPPTVDRDVFVRKTYPGEPANMLRPPSYPEGPGRDIYAAVIQVEGSQHGLTGLLALGFLYPQVSEMLFPNEEEFCDFFLHRYASDFEHIMTANGKMAWQHPAGMRITVGRNLDRIALYHKDHDGRYEIRRNRDQRVGMRIHLPEGVTDAGAEVGYMLFEEWTPGGSHRTFSNFQQGDITEEASGKRANIREGATQNVDSNAGADRLETAGGDIKEKAGGSIIMKADTKIKMNAPYIYLN